jgi:filamentous hemagglutinin
MKRTLGPQLIPGEVVRGTVGSAPSAASPIAKASSGINYVLNGTGTTLDPVSPQLLLSNLPANLQPSTTLFYYNPQAEDAALQAAALKQTGQATFVNGLSTDSQLQLSVTDQEKLVLYANAQAYAKANDIPLGQALTQQQIGELTQPMLWYVEQTVPEPGCTATGTLSCPTVTALMPQVYLPANTSSLSADGNIVASDSLQLNFGDKQTGGSILNTGTIASGGSLTVTTGTLTNQANQVDVGEIWQNVKGGYLETTGTTVQPGGFMSAAAGQMTLNVSQLKQIGGLLQEVNPDGSANNAATQQLLAQVLQQLGGNFTQTAVSDDLHTHFVAAGGFGITQLAAMVAAIAASFLTAGGATMALGALANTLGGTMLVGMASGMAGTLASQIVSGNGLDFGAILKAGAISALTAGITNGITYNSSTGFGLNSFSQSVTALPPGTFTLGQLAGLSNISSALVPGATAASGTLPQMALAMGAMATLDAGVQTAIGGGSFLNNLKNDAVADVAAAGAYAIGDEAKTLTNELGPVGGELAYTGLHAVLGCAASAAEGTGCAGGAVGGAASAAFSPDLLKAIDPTGAALSPGQQAAMAGFATLLGGGLAGLAGANAQGGATAAQNEVLNNTDKHPEDAAKNGGVLGAVGDWLKNTYGDPVGSIENWIGQFGGLAQSDANKIMSEPHLVQVAQGVYNGASAAPDAGGGPTVGPDAAPVSGPSTGQATSLETGNAPPNATFSSNGNGDGTSTSSLGSNLGEGATSGGPATNGGPFTPLTDGGGLQVYEDAGGHLIERHVGMSDADLANRLATSNVSSASTFTDRASAETAVSAAIDSNRSAIQDYLAGNSNGYLAIEYVAPTPVGTSLSRGATNSVPVNNVRVVITKDPTMPTGYRIVTGYPHQ